MGSLVALLVSGCAADRAPPPERILLVTVDTLRADRVGCYGAEQVHTPHMDTMAAAGVRFEQALSPVPLTLPAHASLFTALEPPAHGVRHNSIHRLSPELPTLPERLREAGYATAAFVGSLVLDRRFGLSRGFDLYDDRMGGRRSAAVVGYAERRADRVVDAVLAWLESAPERFFLWVHFYDPHARYDPPPGFASAFPRRPYDGEIAFVDAQLGRLLDALRARGGGALLVALTSDHGESLGEHGEPSHSYSLYEATQRVPLLLVGPGLPAGRAVAAPVRLLDLAPTLLELAGAAPLPGVEGRSLLPLLAPWDRGEPRLAYLETLATQLDFGWSPLLGLRSGGWKYIRAPQPELYDLRDDPGELENRVTDHPGVAAELDRRLAERLERARPPRTGVELDAGERALLRGLGYAPSALPPPAPLGQVGGPDPKRHMHVLVALAETEDLLERGQPAAAWARIQRIDVPEAGTAVPALRAAAALAAGRPREAEASARIALERAPRRPDLLGILGRSLEAQGRPEAAREAFSAAARAREAGPGQP